LSIRDKVPAAIAMRRLNAKLTFERKPAWK
jgi:hypothetical protein